MGVAPVRQELDGCSRMHGENADAQRDPPKIVEHVVEQPGFDMLEHVDAGDKNAWPGRRRPLGYPGS